MTLNFSAAVVRSKSWSSVTHAISRQESPRDASSVDDHGEDTRLYVCDHMEVVVVWISRGYERDMSKRRGPPPLRIRWLAMSLYLRSGPKSSRTLLRNASKYSNCHFRASAHKHAAEAKFDEPLGWMTSVA